MPNAKTRESKLDERKSGKHGDLTALCPEKLKSAISSPRPDLSAKSFQAPKARRVDDYLESPSRKRVKYTQSTDREDTPGYQGAMRAEERFNFSSPSRRTPGIIDLTSESKNGTPRKKKLIGSGGSKSAPHVIVINKRKQASKPDPNEYYSRVWEQLDAALKAIFAQQKLPSSMEELYKGVEIACRQDRAEPLYKNLCERCCYHIEEHVKVGLLQVAGAVSDVEVLNAVVQAWLTWRKHMEVIRSIFYYLDRSYLLHHAFLQSLDEMGKTEFRNRVFRTSGLKSRILNGACDVVSADRQGTQDDTGKALFRDAIEMFHALTVYTKSFEPRFLAASEQYFLSWADYEISKRNLAGYIEQCRITIDMELSRCNQYGLDQTTMKGLELYLEDVLVDQRQVRLLDVEDVGELLSQDTLDILARLFALLQRRRLGEKLRPAFEAYIVKQGSDIVFDEEREQEMVTRLLDFKRKLDSIWEVSFQRHEGLGHSLREAFESFINKSQRSSMTWGTDNPKPGEMIAKYVDAVLKGGSRAVRNAGDHQPASSKAPDDEDLGGSSDDEDVEIGKQLDQVLDLFRFVHGKAVFEAFYKRDLARRLLLGRSASADSEKSMLTRLKSECGAGFTHNLEQMFKDIEMAREEISSYKSMLDERSSRPAFDLNVNVLSASAWPSYPNVSVNVPEHILKATANFEQHYKVKHTGRRLEWKHALAHCQLKATFPKGVKEIVVSCFQAVILMAFNKGGTMSYTDLQAASGLDDTELKRTLQSLACARYRVLSKNPKGKDVNVDDTFAVNVNFSHPKYRIKINQIQAKETKAENQQTHERVAADRNYETQAAIVRIMKSRKKITHAELVSEVLSATKKRGALDPSDIKKNIEKLIDKDYMERDDEGRNVYSYVA